MIYLISRSDNAFQPLISSSVPKNRIVGYDFENYAETVFEIVNMWYGLKLTDVRFDSINEVLCLIEELVRDIDIDDYDFQQSERDHVRVQYEEGYLSIDVFIAL
jgi:hypothetical protein